MNRLLYLDTARLGQMSPTAQRAQADFARYAGEVGAAISLDEFLQQGASATSPEFLDRYPGLASWQGVATLKHSLRRLAGLEDQLPMLLAARSAQLMKLAAILLCRSCRNILISDLGWPPYHQLLQSECRRTSRRLTRLELAADILQKRLCAQEVAKRVASEFIRFGCDGLFLTAVGNRGIRLPISEIVNTLRDRCRFVVIDGAQDFCHVGRDVVPESCDLYLAGCHKWLAGFHPLGIAFYGSRRSRCLIEIVLQQMFERFHLDDPLLRFVERLPHPDESEAGETVNLAALFSCSGAVHDAMQGSLPAVAVEQRLVAGERTAEMATDSGWVAQLPDRSLRSGIMMLQAMRTKTRLKSAATLRRAFHEHRVALTAYDGGLLRLSMPATPLGSDELAVLDRALRATA